VASYHPAGSKASASPRWGVAPVHASRIPRVVCRFALGPANRPKSKNFNRPEFVRLKQQMAPLIPRFLISRFCRKGLTGLESPLKIILAPIAMNDVSSTKANHP
jgi:hypothetical protein